jgi:hemerythrin-like metal-binding protein
MKTKPIWRLEWDESLSTDIPEIDAEHRHFIRLVNELNEAIIGRMNKKEIKSRMRAILGDAVMHFAHEEAMFKEWGYPDAQEHARKHAQIIFFLNEIMESIDHGRMAHGWLEAGLAMKQVLTQHLLNEDMKYRDYHAAQGQLCRPVP